MPHARPEELKLPYEPLTADGVVDILYLSAHATDCSTSASSSTWIEDCRVRDGVVHASFGAGVAR